LLSVIFPVSAFAQATLLPPGEQCFTALTPTSGGPNGTGTGFVGLLGTITGGSGGTSGTYGGVPLIGGNGTGATANITVSGGIVTAVAILNPGVQYVVGDVLSASSANIGNVAGFSIPISSVYINQSLAGGTVGYYIPNTNTFKQTWQNAGQTILNTNPVMLDANGCAIIYGSGIYRQVLKDSLGNTIWDQLTASTNQNNPYWANLAGGTPNAITVVDTAFAGTDGQIIGFIPLSTNTGATTINPSGFGTYPIVKDTATGAVALSGGEIVAGSPSNVVYVSFSASQQNFHIINLVPAAASASASIATPQGYLTLQNLAAGGPVQGQSDITGATMVYYSPYVGNQIPIWNGSSFSILTFAELSLALSSAQSGSSAYDVCIFNNNGSPVAIFGPAWSNSTAGAGSRGTGGGTAQLQNQNGLWVNAAQVVGNNGATIYTVPALQCTYVGSIFTDATPGQVSAYRTFGVSRKFGVWNAYNQNTITMMAGLSTSSWAYNVATIRASDANSAATVAAFTGLPTTSITATFTQAVEMQNSNSSSTLQTSSIGIGLNSLTAYSGQVGTFGSIGSGATGLSSFGVATAILILQPTLGLNNFNQLEQGNATSSITNTFFGTNGDMQLTVSYRG
jgi:hypothetical protein